MRAAIFDLDGTLVDSLRDIAEFMNETLDAAGLPTHPLAAYRHFVGSGARVLGERATAGHEVDVDALIEAFEARYRDEPMRHTRAFDGMDALLDEIVGQGIIVGVLSNKPHHLTEIITAELFPKRFREVWGLRPEYPRKPDPTSAFEVARRLDVAPEQCIFVGDTDVDMLTAVNAGMKPVGVTWGFRPREELEAAGAAFIATDPAEIARALESC